MTNEELNTALYEKMFAEQETYRAWLLSQPPEEILNHTYEYTVRENILMSLEYHDLPDAQVRALLKSSRIVGALQRAKPFSVFSSSGARVFAENVVTCCAVCIKRQGTSRKMLRGAVS